MMSEYLAFLLGMQSQFFCCLSVCLLAHLFVCLFVCFFACLFEYWASTSMLTWYAASARICLERFQPLFSSFIQPQTCAITFVWSPPFQGFSIALPDAKRNWLTNGIFPWVALSLSVLRRRGAAHIVSLGSQALEMNFFHYKFYGEEHLLTKGWMCVIDNILCLQYSSFLSNIPWVQRWSVTRLLAAVLAGSRHLVLAHTDGLVASPGSNLLTGRVFWLVVAS